MNKTCADCEHWKRWTHDKDGIPTYYPIGDCLRRFVIDNITTEAKQKKCLKFEEKVAE